jgi:Ser/Thr protein kinase RdoA (MazF antagonist)
VAEWDQGLLDKTQAAFVERHLGVPALVEDMSWGLVDTHVLHVRTGDQDFVVKAAGPDNHHIPREITAYESYTARLARSGRAARLVTSDRATNLLITEYQPGVLVEGTPFEWASDVHAQAGLLLRSLHDQQERVDTDYERRATAKALSWLDRPHRISPRVDAEARRILGAYRPAPVVVVPTHGDWHPRNWLIDDDRVRVIDFGRFDFRPRETDLCRLANQQWREIPALEVAFLNGYGADPRGEEVWPIELLREAISTAAWAFLVGDVAFEAQGHRMLDEAISRF